MARPELIPVESEAVEAVGYDAEERELHVRFRGGGTYAYAAVTSKEYEDLLEAESLGGYVNREIKPRHTYRQVED